MKRSLFVVGFIAFVMSFSAVFTLAQSSATGDKPGRIEAVVVTVQATVESVDHENRKVTLKGSDGETVTIDVDERVKNLPQVEVGDVVTMDYIEAVSIQVLAKNETEPDATTVKVVKSAEPGQKPASVAMETTTVVATVEAIDKDQQLVTLKGVDGEIKTVKAENPENLEKVKVGDKVAISHTTAIGISVTE